jgi:hypothetical protein
MSEGLGNGIQYLLYLCPAFKYIPSVSGRTALQCQQEFRARIFKLSRSPRIDSKEPISPGCVAGAGICKQSMGASNRAGVELSYRPGRLRWLAELISWDRYQYLGSLKVKKFGLQYDNPIPTRFLAPIDMF